MSPNVSPKQVAQRPERSRNAAAGILVEGAFAFAFFGLGYLACLLAWALRG